MPALIGSAFFDIPGFHRFALSELNVPWVPKHFTHLCDHEPIHRKELRGVLRYITLTLKDVHKWNMKHLILCDKMSICLVLDNG